MVNYLKELFKINFSSTNFSKVIFSTLLTLSCLSFAQAANITLSPNAGSVEVGKSFSVDVKITGNSDNINAVSAALSFPTDILQISSISKAGSFITTWAEEPKYSNQEGTASVEGVALNPGFSGATGKVVTITFKTKASGTASVTLKSGQVLANDGNATNVLGTLGTASFNVTDTVKVDAPVKEVTVTKPVETNTPTITSSSYPDQNKWYATKDAMFSWSIPSGVTAVRTLYDDKEVATPTKVYDTPIASKTFTLDEDGINYMHVQFKTSSGWGNVAHYKFQVDTTAPNKLEATFPTGPTGNDPTPQISIVAEDKLSGLDHFSVSVDNGETVIYPITSTSLYNLPKQSSGKHTAVIDAYDKAGNRKEVSVDYIIQLITPPLISSYNKNLEVGGKLSISGNTYPKTNIEVVLTSVEGDSSTEKTVSNDQGEFTLKWVGELKKGVYEMKTRVVEANGNTSEYSENRTIIVENVPLIRVGVFIMNWMSMILILILAGFCTVAVFWYSLLQFGRFRRKVHRTIKEAETVLKTNAQALRRDIEEFYNLLLKVERRRELTKEEQAIMKKFKKRIDTVEEEIEKKLEAIG